MNNTPHQKNPRNNLEVLSLGGLLFVGLTATLATIFSLALGKLTHEVSFSSLLMGAGASFFLVRWWKREDTTSLIKDFPPSSNIQGQNHREETLDGALPSTPPALKFIVFSLCVASLISLGYFHFLYLLYPRGEDLSTLNPFNYGDLPFHLNLIRALARGLPFWPENLELSGHPLRYPLGMDLFNSLWENLGVPTSAHLFLVGFSLFLIFVFLLYRWMSYWGWAVFFLSGGASSLWQVLGREAWNPLGVEWKNLFLCLFVPQRGFLWAFPVGVFLLKEFFNGTILKTNKGNEIRVSEGNRQVGQPPWDKQSSQDKQGSWEKQGLWGPSHILFVLLLSIIPLFHLHTFFFLLLFFFGASWGDFSWSSSQRRTFWIYFLLPSLIHSLPLLWLALFADPSGGGQVIHWSQGWMHGEGSSFGVYLLKNFGLWLIVPFSLMVALALRRNDKPWWTTWTLGLGVLFFFLMMAPWDWDNIKLLVWVYLILNYLFYTQILTKFPNAVRLEVEWLLCLCFFFPGLFYLSRSYPALQASVNLQNRATISSIESLTQWMDPGETVISSSVHNHPLNFLGQKFFHGYLGHIWSHGYLQKDLNTRGQQLNQIMKGEPGWKETLRSLKIRYIYWGQDEKKEFGSDEKPWMKEYPLVFQTGDIRVYRIYDTF